KEERPAAAGAALAGACDHLADLGTPGLDGGQLLERRVGMLGGQPGERRLAGAGGPGGASARPAGRRAAADGRGASRVGRRVCPLTRLCGLLPLATSRERLD